MRYDEARAWVRTVLDEFTASNGEVNTLDLISEVEERFGLTPKDAEEAVYSVTDPEE